MRYVWMPATSSTESNATARIALRAALDGAPTGDSVTRPLGSVVLDSVVLPPFRLVVAQRGPVALYPFGVGAVSNASCTRTRLRAPVPATREPVAAHATGRSVLPRAAPSCRGCRGRPAG